MRRVVLMLSVLLAAAACTQPATASPAAKAAPAAKRLGIRPNGDTEITPGMGQVPPGLRKVYSFIDEHRRRGVRTLPGSASVPAGSDRVAPL